MRHDQRPMRLLAAGSLLLVRLPSETHPATSQREKKGEGGGGRKGGREREGEGQREGDEERQRE